MIQNIKDAFFIFVVIVLGWYAWQLTHWVGRLETRIADDVRIVSAEIGAGVQALEDRVERRVEKIESRFVRIEKWFEAWFK